MAIFYSADHHFGHKNIITYCNRPYENIYHMDIDMIDKWNITVKPKDIVYYMGDLSFNPQRYRSKLNGKIILIRGNHDKQKYFQLFDEVYDYLSLQIGNYKCFLSHNPINADDSKYCWKDYRRQAFGHDFYLVGHIHEKWRTQGRNLNVGVDQWGFFPVEEEKIINILESIYYNN